jgi:LysM repeat protein
VVRASLRAITSATLTAGLVLAGSAAAADTLEVQPGDTLSSIARADDRVSSWQQLAGVNGLADPDLIFPGDVLAVTGSGGGEPAPEPEPTTTTVDDGVWAALAECESGGDWSINTGNGYYGGLQFLPSSWEAAGGSGMPHEASPDEQIRVAENLLEMQGWGAWPACSSQLGLR